MRAFVGLLVLSLALVANGASLTSRVGGGTDAPEGKYPYQVSLWVSESYQCGGSIIHPRWILTAAHCFATIPTEKISAVVGSHLLSKPGKRFQAEEVIVHKDWSESTIHNDIALIRLAEEIVYSDKVQPILLPASDYITSSPNVVLTGWGSLVPSGPHPDNLQQIDLKVISNEECYKTYKQLIEKQICTSTVDGKGACRGDSGGPLVEDGVQVGIVSYGGKCGRNVPGVYTRVQSYADWIVDKIGTQ